MLFLFFYALSISQTQVCKTSFRSLFHSFCCKAVRVPQKKSSNKKFPPPQQCPFLWGKKTRFTAETRFCETRCPQQKTRAARLPSTNLLQQPQAHAATRNDDFKSSLLLFGGAPTRYNRNVIICRSCRARESRHRHGQRKPVALIGRKGPKEGDARLFFNLFAPIEVLNSPQKPGTVSPSTTYRGFTSCPVCQEYPSRKLSLLPSLATTLPSAVTVSRMYGDAMKTGNSEPET